jgi:ATP-binding cassette subfamily C protein LapB
LHGNFSFRNVTLEFGHGKAPVIDALTLEIIPGEKICVVGSNGSGKSTFMKLLTGLYSPSKGSVYLDNTDMENLDNSDFAANVGVVYQDPWLFSGSIRQNLLAKKPYASQEEIDFALDASCARLVIERLENGLDFQVGENGKGLSHGEKQVICIARAMVGHPSVLLFDEPTSALDGKTEQVLADNLRRHFSKATCIFITHRPAIGKFSDRILHLEKGQLLADTTSETFFSRQMSKL